MRYLAYLSLYVFFTSFMCSCSQKAPTIINQAPDYSPIGEAFKFIGLCILGVSVVIAAASIIRKLNK